MLTLAEKLLFLAALALSLYLTCLRFRQLYLVVRRGAGEFPTRNEIAGRLAQAAGGWLTFGNLWKIRRRVASSRRSTTLAGDSLNRTPAKIPTIASTIAAPHIE